MQRLQNFEFDFSQKVLTFHLMILDTFPDLSSDLIPTGLVSASSVSEGRDGVAAC